MNLQDDLQKLAEDGQKAYALIEAGRLGAAQGILSRLKRSWYISDALRIAVPLEGLILFRKRKKRRALELLQAHVGYLWGDEFALELMRACQEEAPSERTKLYRMRIKGGVPVLGAFTHFGPEYITSVEVYADDEFDAMKFLDTLLTFSDPDSRRLIEFSELPSDNEDAFDWKGIYYTNPFAVDRMSERELQEA